MADLPSSEDLREVAALQALMARYLERITARAEAAEAKLAEIHARASDACKKYHAVSGNHGPRMAYALALHDIATLAHPTIAEER